MLDFDSLLFHIEISNKMARPGSLLVAEPFMRDTYFSHAAVLLVDHDGTGGTAMGIVLNHPTGYTLQGLVPQVRRDDSVAVYCGGPMSCDRLYFVHTLGSIIRDARHVEGDIYIGGNFDDMVAYINSGYPVEGHIRFFIGYSGWSEGQLDRELRDNVWAVADMPDPIEALTLDSDTYWHSVVRSMGRPYRGWLFHPQNPHAN